VPDVATGDVFRALLCVDMAESRLLLGPEMISGKNWEGISCGPYQFVTPVRVPTCTSVGILAGTSNYPDCGCVRLSSALLGECWGKTFKCECVSKSFRAES